jgi:hypothetical protein
MGRRRVRALAASVIALAVVGAVVGLAAWHGSRTPTRSHIVQPALAKKKSYAQLVAANYKVLTPKRTNRLLRFADAAYACMSKQLELGKPRPQRTKIVMALGPGTSAPTVAQVSVRCTAKIGDPPAGSSFQVRGRAVILYLPKYCILDKKVARARRAALEAP